MLRGCDFLIISFLLLLILPFTAAAAITKTQQIRDGETIKSAGRIFELGFFSPNNSVNRYVGIWYHKIPVQTVVWDANAENPLMHSSGVSTIGLNGNLVVFHGEENIHWLSNVSITSNNTSATLSDNGNLVLRDGHSGLVLWQSFDHPSNTLLPGMKIGLNLRTGESGVLRSWKNNNDPAPGIFSFGIDQHDSDQFFIWNKSVPYWRTGYWKGRTYNKIPEANNDFLFHFITPRINDVLYFEYSGMYNDTLLVMDTSGQLHCQIWHNKSNSWHLVWFQPRDRCSLYAGCGPYGSCNNHNTPKC